MLSTKDYERILSGLRRNLAQAAAQLPPWRDCASKRQIHRLRDLMGQGLADSRHDNRVRVLSEILGWPIETSAELWKWEASVLIGYFTDEATKELSEHGRILLQAAEFIVSTRSEKELATAQARDRERALSNLQAAAGLESGDARGAADPGRCAGRKPSGPAVYPLPDELREFTPWLPSYGPAQP